MARQPTHFLSPVLNWFRGAFGLENSQVSDTVSTDPVTPVVDVITNRYWPEILHLSGIRSLWGSVSDFGVGNQSQLQLFCPADATFAIVIMSIDLRLENVLTLKATAWSLGIGQNACPNTGSLQISADTFLAPFAPVGRLRSDGTGLTVFTPFDAFVVGAVPTGNLVTVPPILSPGWGFSALVTGPALVANDIARARFQWLEVPLSLLGIKQ